MGPCTVIGFLHERHQFSTEGSSEWDDPFKLGINRATKAYADWFISSQITNLSLGL